MPDRHPNEIISRHLCDLGRNRAASRLCAAALLVATTLPAHAEIASAYTQFDSERDCATLARADEGDGDWADLACAGYKGYPMLVSYSDVRETIFYGFPPDGELPRQPGFHPFNHAGETVEWRVESDGRTQRPFAAIHRWFVSGGEASADIEILVVSKVARIDDRSGCFVGFVMASGNSQANAQARAIADDTAPDFDCGVDEAVIEGDGVGNLLSR